MTNTQNAAQEQLNTTANQNRGGASTEQRLMAGVLDVLSKIGLLSLLATFSLYMLGKPAAHVSAKMVSKFWSMRVGNYLQAVHLGAGWSWVHHLGESDIMTFAPIAFLCLLSAICYSIVVPFYLKKKDRLYAILATAEVLVLLLAASGILSRGH